MSRISKLLEVKKINGEYGKYGFISNEIIKDAEQFNFKSKLEQQINGSLLDDSVDQNHKLYKELNKLSDIRVEVEFDNNNKLLIKYPNTVNNSKQLLSYYHDTTRRGLNKLN